MFSFDFRNPFQAKYFKKFPLYFSFTLRSPSHRRFCIMPSAPASLKCPPLPAKYKDEPIIAKYEPVPAYDVEVDLESNHPGNLEPVTGEYHVSPPSNLSLPRDNLIKLEAGAISCQICLKRQRLGPLSSREKAIFALIFMFMFFLFVLLMTLFICLFGR
jgi:hypothetical protein